MVDKKSTMNVSIFLTIHDLNTGEAFCFIMVNVFKLNLYVLVIYFSDFSTLMCKKLPGL